MGVTKCLQQEGKFEKSGEVEREREREITLLCHYFHHKTSNVNAGLLLNRLFVMKLGF